MVEVGSVDDDDVESEEEVVGEVDAGYNFHASRPSSDVTGSKVRWLETLPKARRVGCLLPIDRSWLLVGWMTKGVAVKVVQSM